MTILVRIRLINGDFWSEDDSAIAVPLDKAIVEAREFLTDVEDAIAQGNIASGSYSEADIEFVYLDGTVVSLTQAEVELNARQRYDPQPTSALAAHLYEYWKDVYGVRPHHIDMTNRESVIDSLISLERYMAHMQATPEGRKQLRDEGWQKVERNAT